MKINNFDLIRLFAASQVLATHAIHLLKIPEPSWLRILDAFPGVPIFFVISGFLISASYERNNSLKNYARNRILRIYPALWCLVFVTIIVDSYLGVNFFNLQTVPWVACQLVGLIYTPQFLSNFGFGSYNGSLWTIPIELQFYVVLPIFYWIFRKNRTALFIGAWLVFVAIAIAMRFEFPAMGMKGAESLIEKLIRYTFVPHFYLFLTGVLLQKMGLYKSGWINNRGVYWLFAYIAFYFLAPTFVVLNIVKDIFLAVVTVSMAYSMTRVSHALLKGNDISYGVYIYHGLVINVFVEIGVGGGLEHLFMLFLCTYVAAYISWVVVEKRFLRRKQRTINPELENRPQETGQAW